MTRSARIAVALVAAIGFTIAATGVAHAAAYRYWTYWTATDGEWTFATAGPASLIPADGAVQGWRFAVTTAAGSATAPRATASFDDICAQTPQARGKKRVALVVDPGDPADTPDGQMPGEILSTCVVAEPDATGYQVLRSVSTVRVDKGLVCGINGYPSGECAPVVDDPTPVASPAASASAGITPSATPSAVGQGSAMDTSSSPPVDADNGSPWALVAVAAFVALIVGTFFWRRRRA